MTSRRPLDRSPPWRRASPGEWRLAPLREATPAPHHRDLEAGASFVIEGGETVSAAPELARLTLNVAMAHTDATSSGRGRRLVYGGHTISVAAAHATRAIPAIATILAWEGCDHLAPVFEGDVLRTELQRDRHDSRAERRQAGAQLRALVSAVRGDERARTRSRLALRRPGGLDGGQSSTACASSRARPSSRRRSAAWPWPSSAPT